jgi:nucleoside-diphosphate-sugar epimerase
MAITKHEEMPRILVAGCGKLGGDMARILSEEAKVFGLRRHPEKVPEGVAGLGADLTDPDQVRQVLPDNLDIVIYCLAPSQYDEQGYRDAYVNGLANLIGALRGQPLKRLFYISSTSVYAQNSDEWVDENSATEPARFSGQQVLAGEQLALESGLPATVVRFSGIYGHTRKRFLDAVQKGKMNPRTPAPYSNRIHEADAARAIAHLSRMALDGRPLESCYLASDCEPVRLNEAVAWVREQVDCQPPVADARTGGRAGSKRCNNQRLLDTGFRFEYPDYKAGYLAIIRDTD